MMTPNRSKSVSRHRAFTLIELLVVIAIIALLAVIAIPSFNRMMEIARRATCRNNVNQIAKACNTYVNDVGMHHNSKYKKALPTRRTSGSPNPATGTWGSTTVGNPACLWLLVKSKRVGRDSFLCPSAKISREHRAPSPSASSFTSSTLSYSYLSQVAFNDSVSDTNNMEVTSALTDGLKSSELAICADQNPRCTVGSSSIRRNDKHNSLNHSGVGQNVGFMDGHADWFSSPIVYGDDIFAADTSHGGVDADGKRGTINDAYLIP